MYEVKAQVDFGDVDQVLDDLVELFESQGKDCTCGTVGNMVIGYIEEGLLTNVTRVILRYAHHVNVQLVEDEELAPA